MKKRRGTAILETSKGILLTSINGNMFLLPGGEAEKGESRFCAAIRELEEETGLIAYQAEVIFRHESHANEHTVVLVKARGTPKPKNEVKHLNYYKPGNIKNLSQGTRDIIKKYYEWKR
ncbi:MAG: NUDIX domain-containing protein [Candidatus Woesearchaeota archaeon]